jgi:hypothetical protein
VTGIVGATVVVITKEVLWRVEATAFRITSIECAEDTIITIVLIGCELTSGCIETGVVRTRNPIIAVGVYGRKLTTNV